MAKVIKEFFCSVEKKAYKVGDDYKGDRKDLTDYLEAPKQQTKEKKIKQQTK